MNILKYSANKICILIGLCVCLFAFPIDSRAELTNEKKNIIVSLENELINTADSSKFKIYKSLCWEYRNFNPDKAMVYGNLAIESITRYKKFEFLPEILNFLGVIYRNKSEYNKAIDYYFRALKIAQFQNNKLQIAYSLNNIGDIYTIQGEYNKSIEYLQNALSMFESVNEKKGLGYCYSQLGKLHSNMQDYTSSLKYFNLALAIRIDNKDSLGVANLYGDIGEIYVKIDSIEKAIKYYELSIALIENISKKVGAKLNLAQSLNGIGIAYFKLGKYIVAEKYFLHCFDLAREIGSLELLKTASFGLSEIYARKSQFNQSYQYLSISNKMNDSLDKSEISKRITQLEMQKDFDKKQLQNELELRQRELIQQERIKQQEIIRNAFLIGFLLMLLLSFVIFKSYRTKKKDNIALKEQKKIIEESYTLLSQQKEEISTQKNEIERQRDNLEIINIELEQQKEEILAQRDEIEEKSDKLHAAFSVIEQKNKHIIDSISYAQRIQSAMLPNITNFSSNYIDVFLVFQPKDIVSGDFYLVEEFENHIVFAVVDCTGHGVPGGFMSMLGINLFKQAIKEFQFVCPSKILSFVSNELYNLLQSNTSIDVKDGMDAAVCIINKIDNTLNYAGVHNPIFLLRKKQIIEFKADYRPLGVEKYLNHFYEVQSINLNIDDNLYMFTDGYTDQFGGTLGRKYLAKNLKGFLNEINDKTIHEKKLLIEENFNSWKGQYEQVDDITVIGAHVKNLFNKV